MAEKNQRRAADAEAERQKREALRARLKNAALRAGGGRGGAGGRLHGRGGRARCPPTYPWLCAARGACAVGFGGGDDEWGAPRPPGATTVTWSRVISRWSLTSRAGPPSTLTPQLQPFASVVM